MDQLLKILGDIVVSKMAEAAPSLYDTAVHFRPINEYGVRPVRHALLKPANVVQKFRAHLFRNDFLCGCLDFTQDLNIEYLVAGLGYKSGKTTIVKEVIYTTGNAEAVNFTPQMLKAIDEHYASDHKAEVILFHNHPKSWIGHCFDNTPIASDQDRAVMLQWKARSDHLARLLSNGGRFLFFVGENGYVNHINTLSVAQFFQMLRELQ